MGRPSTRPAATATVARTCCTGSRRGIPVWSGWRRPCPPSLAWSRRRRSRRQSPTASTGRAAPPPRPARRRRRTCATRVRPKAAAPGRPGRVPTARGAASGPRASTEFCRVTCVHSTYVIVAFVRTYFLCHLLVGDTNRVFHRRRACLIDDYSVTVLGPVGWGPSRVMLRC